MNVASLKLLTRRPPVIVAGLVVVTVLAFLGVNRLVNHFREQEKALARHLYEHGMSNICRARGIAGSGMDFLICAVAHLRNWEVFTTDRDFVRYNKVLPLRLY